MFMRLANRLKQQIKNGILNSFGCVDIYLFGSRIDDSKKGGDIDIAVDIEISPEQFKKYKIRFISFLLKAGYDLKIDVVPYNSTDKLLRDEVHKTVLKIN